MVSELEVQSNYRHIVNCYNDGLRGCGLEGGSRSGKNFDASAFVVQYVIEETGRQINIGRDFLSILKKTTYKTLRDVWGLAGLPLNYFNKSATQIHFNGNIVNFFGANDNILLSHGLESDLLWLNETQGVEHEARNQLEQRLTDDGFFIFDYNPSSATHPIYDYEYLDDYKLKRTTIFDNKYAPKNALKKILSYAHPEIDSSHILDKIGMTNQQWLDLLDRNIKLGTANLYMWSVYGLGKRGAGEDVIFHFELYEDLPDESEIDWKTCGIDFGYTDDPTTHVDCVKAGNAMFLKENFYETGLLNKHIANRIISNGHEDEVNICDSSPRQNTDELVELDINAYGYNKFPDSVYWGIQKMKSFKLYIHHESKNLIREYSNYKWKKDKQKGGYVLNSFGHRVPVDGNDHTVQASIYGGTYYYAHR